MSEHLPLRSLEIEGYRGIRHLQLPKLEQVNLFVGMNNAGKTSLLEAIRIHAASHPVSAVWEVLRQRRESNRFRRTLLRGGDDSVSEGEIEQAAYVVESLFFRHPNNRIDAQAEFTSVGRCSGTSRLLLPWRRPREARNPPPVFFGSEDDSLLSIERAGDAASLPLKAFFGYMAPADEEVVAIGPGGFDGATLTSLWSRSAGLGKAPLVEEAFRGFLPKAQRIHILSGATAFNPVLAIEVEGTSRPIPLTEMGDGARRVLGIVLAMVNAESSILLIDEVENGLHYSVQQDVWRSILRLAEDLDVQVFATTHSWDAIQAFSLAARESSSVEGRMHRLENTDGDVRLVEFDEEDLGIVTRQQIEVR